MAEHGKGRQRKRRGGALVKTNRAGQRPVSRPAWLLAKKGGFCPCLPGDTMSQEWLSGPRERLLSSGRRTHISRGQEALAPESPLLGNAHRKGGRGALRSWPEQTVSSPGSLELPSPGQA